MSTPTGKPFNPFDDPTIYDPIGAVLGYLRFSFTTLATLFICLRMGFDWAAARIPLQFAPFAIFAVASSWWADSFSIALQNSLCLFTMWIAVSLIVHRSGAAAAVIASMYLTALIVVTSAFVALVFPKIGIHTGNEVFQAAHAGRWRGIFAHKNSLGPWAAYGSVTFFTHIRMIKNANMIFWWIARISAVLCLLLSGSATALFVATTMLLVYFFLKLLCQSNGPTVIVIAAIILVSLGYFVNLFSDQLWALVGRDASLTGRSEIWEFARSYIWDEGLFFGQGFMMEGGANYLSRMTALFLQPIAGAESGYLTLILDLGLIGFVLFIVPYFSALRNGLQWIRVLEGEERSAVVYMSMTIIGSLVHGISESTAFLATGFDGVICFGALFFLLSLPKSPAKLTRFSSSFSSETSQAKLPVA